MTQVLIGRAVAGVGAVAGIVAIWLDAISAGGFSEKYSDDGTTIAYLLITLLLAAGCLAAGAAGGPMLDAGATVAGGAAFGFYLFFPLRSPGTTSTRSQPAAGSASARR